MYFFLTDFHFLLYLFGFIAGKLIFYFQTLMYDHRVSFVVPYFRYRERSRFFADVVRVSKANR